VLLTVFRKTRQHDQRQIDRAVRAQKTCERDHLSTDELAGRAGMTADGIECIEEGSLTRPAPLLADTAPTVTHCQVPSG